MNRQGFVLSLLGGLLFPLGFEPLNLWPLTILGLVAICYSVSKASSVRETFVFGWLFGFGKYAVGASWIQVSLQEYGNMGKPLSVAVMFFGIMLISLLPALFLAAGYLLQRRFAKLPVRQSFVSIMVFLLCWVLYEYSLELIQFPWLFAGYVFLHTPFVGLAAIGGSALLSILAAFIAASIVYLRHPVEIQLAFVAVIGLGLLGQLTWTTPTSNKKVSVVHPDLGLDERRSGGMSMPDHISNLMSARKVEGSDLTIWPETVVWDWDRFRRSVFPFLPRSNYLLGVFEREHDLRTDETKLYNSVVLISSEGTNLYRKQELVPFGEYIPFDFLLTSMVERLEAPISTLTPGDERYARVLHVDDLRIAPAICYEIAYSRNLAQLVAQNDANLIVTVSEDGWFGNSWGPRQHMQIARMRAVETGRYVVRSANQGISGIISPRGNLVQYLAIGEQGIIQGDVDLMAGKTPYLFIFGNKLLASLYDWLILTLGGTFILVIAMETITEIVRGSHPPD